MSPFSWKDIWVPEMSPWEVILRSAVTYLFIQAMFRALGRKEWTRYSVFNATVLFLIAVALRTTLVGNDQSLTSGILAFTVIMSMDWVFSYLTYRSPRLADLLSGPVRALVREGRLLPREMRRARVSEDELLAQVRLQGRQRLDEVEQALLERSGKISFLWKDSADRASAPGKVRQG